MVKSTNLNRTSTNRFTTSNLCRECLFTNFQPLPEDKCLNCGSSRILSHPELYHLAIAHVDCDAFFAAIEKRDNPALQGKPVIVGGGRRGVVAAACYIARAYGVRSAMPMFKALHDCPQAVVIKPDFQKYKIAGEAIHARMKALTPLVQPISIDEAFLDLTGTERLHKASPAETLVQLAQDIQQNVGISVSIGLSHNKLLAKIASDIDKPRGFFIIGKAEAQTLLAPRPISLIWGVGPSMQQKLALRGYRTIGDLQNADPKSLTRDFGDHGLHLYNLAHGKDTRKIIPERMAKSVSSETTFNQDITTFALLEEALWPLCEKVSLHLKKKRVLGSVITLKLKRADFKSLTRRVTLDRPTNLASVVFNTGKTLLRAACDDMRGPYRLIGIGASTLSAADTADQYTLLADPHERLALQEKAIDTLREKFGPTIIGTGRNIK